MTMLAPITSAATNLSREFAYQSCCNTCRAFDCQYTKRSPMFAYASSSARSSINAPSLAFAFSSSARSASASGKSSRRMLSASGHSLAGDIENLPKQFGMSAGTEYRLQHLVSSLAEQSGNSNGSSSVQAASVARHDNRIVKA